MASLCNHKSRGRGEGFTGSHTLLEAGGRSVASRPCVQAHLAPKSCWAFWPCWGSWHCLPTSPLGSRWLCDNLRLPWKKKKKANYLFWRKRRKNLSPTDSKPNGQTNGENKADGCFCHIFLHNHCFLPRLCLQNLVAAIVHVTSKLADDLRLGRGWQRAHMGEPAPEQMLSLH